MAFAEFNLKKNLLVRAEQDSDLVQFITKLAGDRGITAAEFTAIGALKRTHPDLKAVYIAGGMKIHEKEG